MLTQHIALVPEAEGVNISELARVSAALQKQVTRDLAPIWGIAATVDAFPYLEDVPIGYWPVILTFCELGRQSGVHIDQGGQPYAQVQMSTHWSLAASRACLEMLVNPFGSRTVSARSLRSDQGPVEFVLEVSGPCGDASHAYAVNDVIVSDFCTPAFFGAGTPQPERYSFAGSLTAPLQLLPGGHLTWHDPVSGNYWLRSHWGDNPIDTNFGAVDRTSASIRELLNACAPFRRPADRFLRETYEARAEHSRRASTVHAHRLRALLGARLERDLAETALATVPDRRVLTEPSHGFDDEPTLEYEVVEVNETEELDPVVTTSPARQLEVRPVQTETRTLQVEARAAKAEASQATHSTPPPLRTATRAAPRDALPSLAPVTLGADRDATKARTAAPWLAALAAAAALFTAFWIIVRSGDDRRADPPALRVPQPSAAAAPAQVLPEPAGPPGSTDEPIALPAARVEVPVAAVASKPASVPRPVTAPTGAPRIATTTAASTTSRERAERRARRDLPVPGPEPAAQPVDGPATGSIEDLIETRR